MKGVGAGMKKGIKIVTIGGGSSYTPELMEGFIKRHDELPISEIWLVDIDARLDELEIVANFAQRMWDATGLKVKIVPTTNRKEALVDADFVTTQFRVGLLDARIKDERIPLSYGLLGQETNGAGGILKAFRTIPVMKEIVDDMKSACPNAWLINFTNPSGIITEAVIKHFGWKKCVGLCNVPEIAMMNEPKTIGKDRDELTYRFVGLNHFHWHKVNDSTGKEITRELMEHINEKNGGTPANIYQAEFSLELLHSMNLLPCGYHRYYFSEKEMLEHSIEEFIKNGTRAEKMRAIESELFEIYKQPNLTEKPEQLQQRGGAYYSDTACECINAIYNNKKAHMVVSTQNKGSVSCLGEDSIVEVSSIVSSSGVEPIAWGELRPSIKGLLQVMKAMEECTINAALTGDYGMALEAFTINPLISSGEDAKRVLDELLVAHERYLPQFAEKITELKAKGIASSDPVIVELMKNGK